MDLTPINDFRKSHQVNTKGALAAVIQLNRFSFPQTRFPLTPATITRTRKVKSRESAKITARKSLPNMASHDSSQQRADEPAVAPWH